MGSITKETNFVWVKASSQVWGNFYMLDEGITLWCFSCQCQVKKMRKQKINWFLVYIFLKELYGNSNKKWTSLQTLRKLDLL